MEGIGITDVLQFFLELVAWVAIGYWGWTQQDGLLRIILGPGAVVLAAAIWGVFRVPNDPGKATVVIPAKLRLVLEMAEFALAALSLYAGGQPIAALALVVFVIVLYVVDGRFVFLMTHKPSG